MSRAPVPVNQAAYRLSVLSRVLAACVGAYGVTSLWAAALALALPVMSGLSRADAVLVTTMSSFVGYTVLALWVFCADSATRAWMGLSLMALPAGLAIWLIRTVS